MRGVTTRNRRSRGVGRPLTFNVSGISEGYARLRARVLTTYDFDEDGDPITTRDGVTVNPHNFFVYMPHDSGFDAAVNVVPLFLEPSDIYQHIIGTQWAMQHRFIDNSLLLGSQVSSTSSDIPQVYSIADFATGSPGIMCPFDENGIPTSGTYSVETIPLLDNDWNVQQNGAIETVRVRLGIRVKSAVALDGIPITVAGCRDALDSDGTPNTSRTYTQSDEAALVVGNLILWDTTLDFTGDSTPTNGVDNALGLKFSFDPASGDSQTSIEYVDVRVTTAASPVGLTEGTITAYNNGKSIDSLDDAFAGDLSGLNGWEAMEKLMASTVADTDTNIDGLWESTINTDNSCDFTERRGADLTESFAFENENITHIDHDEDGDTLASQTIVYGPGSGLAQTRLVDKSDYTSSDGLYDAASDWTVTDPATYGFAARPINYVNDSERDSRILAAEGISFHGRHREPQHRISLKVPRRVTRPFGVGDGIAIKDFPTHSNSTWRVQSLTYSWGTSRPEEVRVEIGRGAPDVVKALGSGQSTARNVSFRASGNKEPSKYPASPGRIVTFEKFDGAEVFGHYPICLEDPTSISRVTLFFNAIPNSTNVYGSALVSDFELTRSLNHTPASLPSGTGVQTATLSTGLTSYYTTEIRVKVRIEDKGGTLDPGSHTDARFNGYFQLGFSATDTGTVHYDTKKHQFSATPSHLDGTGDANTYITEFRIPVDDINVATATVRDFFRGVQFEVEFEESGTYSASHDFDIDFIIEGFRPYPKFGSRWFDGDGGMGDDAPVYPIGVRISGNPAVTNGVPTEAQFDAADHPTKFGETNDEPWGYSLDVTNRLAVDTDGVISRNQSFWFTAESDSAGDNVNGKGALLVSHSITRLGPPENEA